MTNQITVSSSPATTTTRHRRRTLTPAKKSASNVGEVAGNTCVACCCCPCVLFECLILAVYKVPANVVRRIKKKKMNGKDRQICGAHPSQQLIDELSDIDWEEFETVKVSVDGSTEAVELDKLMWDRFKDAGFWRTASPKFD